jgi:putative acetyltransferase
MTARTEYQGQGIGKSLTENILDFADNCLMLLRIELDVTVDNEKAINLYQPFGFEIEGTKKDAIIKNGKYADLLMKARYTISTQIK